MRASLTTQNIEREPRESLMMSLGEQFAKVVERYPAFPLELTAQNRNTIGAQQESMKRLAAKVRELVYGEGTDIEIELYEQMEKGEVTKEGIIYVTKMRGKANVLLSSRVQLPVYHYSAFRGLYMDYYRDYILDQEEKDKNNRIKINAQNKIKSIHKITDVEEIKKYISGEKGEVFNFNIHQEDGELKIKNEDAKMEELFKKISG